LLRPLGDSSRLGLFHVLDGNALNLRGEFHAALDACNEALRIARAIGDAALEARAQFQLGVVHWCLEEFAVADKSLRAAHEYFSANPTETRHGLHRGVAVAAVAYAARGRVAIGDLAQAELDLLDVLAIAERHASPFDWFFASITAGEVNELAGRLDDAAVWFNRALACCQSANALLLSVMAASRLGVVETRSGKVTAGLARLQSAVADAEQMSFRAELPFCLAGLAEATLASGDVTAAEQLAERARSVSVTGDDRTATILSLLVLGHCAQREGRRTTARARFRAALAIAEAHQFAPLAAKCRVAIDALSSKARGRLVPRSQTATRAPVTNRNKAPAV